jgi:hypothetical protein
MIINARRFSMPTLREGMTPGDFPYSNRNKAYFFLPERPGRIEPRVIKRRSHGDKLVQELRRVLREMIISVKIRRDKRIKEGLKYHSFLNLNTFSAIMECPTDMWTFFIQVVVVSMQLLKGFIACLIAFVVLSTLVLILQPYTGESSILSISLILLSLIVSLIFGIYSACTSKPLP